ncbi:HlyD family type I secretion periplasmic adaptor subunit [Aquitalea sp. ASV11]|uniref:HlyD family type I secretion periplasmic adaptor subunit n=1 Tax=Aquitalea sp. ASV11 TaxID=2795103 RepID=UPI0018ED83F6|nr:HlyD family type I secretion periplasmic adaptor subunit [Aquitalea sp. ASV11]
MSLRHRLQAGFDLLCRYVSVFRHFWRIRDTLKTDFFNKQEAEFLPAGLALREAPDSATLRLSARVLMSLLLVAILWACFGRIDIIVTATGKIIPSARIKTIASVDVASVKALHVKEGQTVRAGEVLVELDASSSDAEYDKAADALLQARLQVARSQALIEAVDQHRPPRLPDTSDIPQQQWRAAKQQLDSQYQDFRAKLQRLDSDIARFAAALPLATQRERDYRILAQDNTVSRHAWLEKEQARIDLAGQLADARNQRTALIAQTRKEAFDAITEGNKIVIASGQDARRAGTRSQLLKLTAPVDGTVQQLTVHTVGGVVPAAQPLMQIVPQQSAVEVEAFIENKDIGFIHVGQTAAVKIDAFEYTKYGTIPAQVSHVSHDAIQDEKRGLLYASKITLDRDSLTVDDRKQALTPGMAVNVDIKTGNRRVIEYLLSPLLRHQQESLRER